MFSPKFYNTRKHIERLSNEKYYKNLIVLRNEISNTCDTYFRQLQAPKVDLFLIAQSVSSPMGKGSDSLPIPIKLGSRHAYLVDSAQFGMEPLVQRSFEMVYCYLPSFRGEDADNRHLNQFYHCEAELRGELDDAIHVVEGLVYSILQNAYDLLSLKKVVFESISPEHIKTALASKKFKRITFDEAVAILTESGFSNFIEVQDYGRQLTSDGEKKLVELVSKNQPLWLTHFDRDVVPFYQQPLGADINKVINADLIFPSINGGFGGEIVGAGQRQSTAKGILESMKRQGVNKHGYEWYLKLRKNSDYKITSGFGLGIERLISWMLQLDCIADAAIYPVIKNHNSEY